jgi:hypothetical protein
MIRAHRRLSPGARVLLDEEQAIPVLPAVVRANVLARARAALAANALEALPSPPRAALPAVWAASLTLAVVAISVAADVAWYGLHAPVARVEAPVLASTASASVLDDAVSKGPNALELIAPKDRDAAPAQPRVLPPPRFRTPPVDTVRGEPRLRRPMRSSGARSDFVAALPPLNEHACLFRDSWLAEERETLRVNTLRGLGRAEDARRAATSFRAHFPHRAVYPRSVTWESSHAAW